MNARLSSKFWIDAYLRLLAQKNIPGFVVKMGEHTAGAIMVKLNTLDGQAQLFERGYDDNFTPIWRVSMQGYETDIDDFIAAQYKIDPDLWVVEVETRNANPMLDSQFLAH